MTDYALTERDAIKARRRELQDAGYRVYSRSARNPETGHRINLRSITGITCDYYAWTNPTELETDWELWDEGREASPGYTAHQQKTCACYVVVVSS